MLERNWQTYRQYIVTGVIALLSLAEVFVAGVLSLRVFAVLAFLLSILSIYLQVQSDRQHDTEMRTLAHDNTILKWFVYQEQVLKDYPHLSDHSGQHVPTERTQPDYPQPLRAPDFERNE
jgi:hypothetical protein